MSYRSLLFATAVTVVAAGGAASAHHSVAGQFDMSQPVTWTGVISSVDWINPHIYVHLDVTDQASGETTTWMLETVPPAMMRRAGLSSAKLVGDGEPVTIEGLRARSDVENLGYILKITYPDGTYYQLSSR